jgi:histidyl-tRNA synthetase
MEAAVALEQRLDCYVVIAKEERREDALATVQALRDVGYRVDFPLLPAKVGKQFQNAEQLNARFALLFGDEWPAVKVKDMASGEQKLIPADDLAAFLKDSFDR